MDLQHLFRPDLKDLTAYQVNAVSHQIKLDANESPFDLPDPIRQQISDTISKLSFHHYPDTTADQLRGTLARYLNVPEDWLVIGNGSDELLAYLAQIFGRQKAAVLFPTPTFSMYRIFAQTAGIPTIGLPLNDSFDLNASLWQQTLDRQQRNLVFFAYPNNPTGNLYDAGVVGDILSRRDTLVVMDEAYYEFSGQTFLEQFTDHKNLVITRTFSKAYGLASLRCGYLVAHPDLINEINKIRLPYNLNQFTQICATIALQHRDLIASAVAAILRGREQIYESLGKIDGIHPFPTEANFVLFRTQKPADLVHTSLIDQGILIRHFGASGPLANCLRVTIGTDSQNQRFLPAIRQALR
jgi:histidinol-phosphate aminotransferase